MLCRAVTAYKKVQLEAAKLLLVFPKTYFYEQGFPTLANLKSKRCNHLDPEDDIQIASTAKVFSF